MSNLPTFPKLVRTTPHPLLLIAGPCVLETRELTLSIAERLKTIADHHHLPLIFKASFDKANRTDGSSGRGPGMEEGLEILREVHAEFDVAVTTDVHESTQVAAVADAVDLIQVPAFLCRQTDLLHAVGKSGVPTNIKKGQFMAPEDMAFAVKKVNQGGGSTVLLTERGASFGYRNLVVDMRSLSIMRQFAPVVFDATHSVQSPGGLHGRTGGNREMVPVLTRAALAAGVDGLFLEVHPDPESSPSDGANMITPETLEGHLPQWLELHAIASHGKPSAGSA